MGVTKLSFGLVGPKAEFKGVCSRLYRCYSSLLSQENDHKMSAMIVHFFYTNILPLADIS